MGSSSFSAVDRPEVGTPIRSAAERPPASVPVEFMAPVVGAILSKVSAGDDVRTISRGVGREFFREPARTETGAVAGLGGSKT